MSGPNSSTRHESPSSGTGTSGRDSSGVHRATGPPRSGPGSRCRCPPPGRRWRRSRHRGHHRRESSDRAGTQVVAVGKPAGDDDRIDTDARSASPCQRISASPPTARTASMTSCSQFDPGNRTTPTRGAIRRRPWLERDRASSITGLLRNREQRSSTSARGRPSHWALRA